VGGNARGKDREKWSLYECVPTLQQSAPSQTIVIRSDIKIKQYSNSENTNRSRLDRGLESTEAVRAVSLSALAYVVT